MGSKFEVSIWGVFPELGNNNYCYKSIWQGESFIKAIIILIKAKTRTGCAKLEWR
jgi:hypothetical protein